MSKKTHVKAIPNMALGVYVDEPCRICGRMLTIKDIREGAIFAGYSKDNKSRAAHKMCFHNARELMQYGKLRDMLVNCLPILEMAMEISMKYEPCGYYCDETVGHVDHKLYNWAKEIKGKIEQFLSMNGEE